VILDQKLTLNHPSLVNEGEETKVLVTAHKREREKKLNSNISYSLHPNNFNIFIDKTREPSTLLFSKKES